MTTYFHDKFDGRTSLKFIGTKGTAAAVGSNPFTFW